MTSNGLMHDGLAYWARRAPDKPVAMFNQTEAIGYGDMARWSDGIAEHLAGLGIAAGDVVALAGGNSIAWIAGAFGILKAGGIIAPFNDRLLGEEMAYLANHSQARLIIADADRTARLADAGVQTPTLAIEGLGRFQHGAALGWREARVTSDDPAMIIFTSGSTARPKGAVMGHGNYLAKFMEMMLLDSRLGADTRAMMPLGLHSSPGLPWGILFTSTLGGTLHFTSKYDAENTLKTLAEHKINFFIGVPMIYDQISKLEAFEKADLSALTFARIGGATPAIETLERWRAAGVVVRQLYGMTEVGGGAIIASEDEALINPHSCGRGLAFSRFRIVRNDGSECDPGEPGHILLQGPGLMLGYWRDPDATAEALAGGWMHTGDIGTVDADGYFKFVDRAKEMIKSGGFNVSPAEIESVLLTHPSVTEAAVFGIKDPKFTETPCACVYLSEPASPKDLIDHCATRLAGFKLPRHIIMLEGPLPRLANEKVDRVRIKSLYGGGPPSSGSAG